MTIYEMRVKWHLDGCWSRWFDGPQITNLRTDETMLSGAIAD